MKKAKFIKVLLILSLLLVLAVASFAGASAGSGNFRAHLAGRNEVPAVDTNAQGQAMIMIGDGSVDYKLIVANILDVTQSHIHCGAEGVNGPVVVFLYPPGPPPVLIAGRSDGVLAEGTFTNANIIPRPDSEACPGGVANLDDLIAKIQSGDAYVNVHTVAWPGGEVRGQLR